MGASTRPVFIVSPPRSGSTLLRLIVGAHPRIAMPPPDWLFDLIYPYLYSYGDLKEPRNLLALAEDLLETPTVKKWPIGMTAAELVARAAEPTFRGLYEALHVAYADYEGKPRWGEKSPRCSLWMDEIHGLFPEAQFIHIVRDGRDVATDLADSSSLFPFSIYSAALLWHRYVTMIRESATRLPSSCFLEVRYEELCADPRLQISRICEFLGEDFAEEMLRPHESQAARMWSSIPNHAKTGKPITTDYCGIFRKRLTDADRAMLDGAIGETLRHSGYPVQSQIGGLPSRMAAQLFESDVITNLGNARYKQWHEERRKRRREAGVWRDSDRNDHFWALN